MASHNIDEKSAISVQGKTEYHNINLYGVLKLTSLSKSWSNITNSTYKPRKHTISIYWDILNCDNRVNKKAWTSKRKIVNKHTEGITGRHNKVVSYTQHLKKNYNFTYAYDKVVGVKIISNIMYHFWWPNTGAGLKKQTRYRVHSNPWKRERYQ